MKDTDESIIVTDEFYIEEAQDLKESESNIERRSDKTIDHSVNEEINDMMLKKYRDQENDAKKEKTLLRVKSSGSATGLSSAIYTTVSKHGAAEMRCIGDGAIGTAMKAITLATAPLKLIGKNVIPVSSFFLAYVHKRDKKKNDHGKKNFVFTSKGKPVIEERDAMKIKVEER